MDRKQLMNRLDDNQFANLCSYAYKQSVLSYSYTSSLIDYIFGPQRSADPARKQPTPDSIRSLQAAIGRKEDYKKEQLYTMERRLMDMVDRLDKESEAWREGRQWRMRQYARHIPEAVSAETDRAGIDAPYLKDYQ